MKNKNNNNNEIFRQAAVSILRKSGARMYIALYSTAIGRDKWVKSKSRNPFSRISAGVRSICFYNHWIGYTVPQPTALTLEFTDRCVYYNYYTDQDDFLNFSPSRRFILYNGLAKNTYHVAYKYNIKGLNDDGILVILG